MEGLRQTLNATKKPLDAIMARWAIMTPATGVKAEPGEEPVAKKQKGAATGDQMGTLLECFERNRDKDEEAGSP